MIIIIIKGRMRGKETRKERRKGRNTRERELRLFFSLQKESACGDIFIFVAQIMDLEGGVNKKNIYIKYI